MAENPEKNKRKGIRRLPGALGGALLALLVIAGIYLAAVLLEAPNETESAAAPEATPPAVSRMQSAVMEDAGALAAMFEAPLPALSGFTPRGEARNSQWDGQTARVVTLVYEGVTVTAVRPAAAAPLLLRGDLDVSMQTGLTVLGLPAMLASRDHRHCLYFSSENAAYALYAPSAEAEELLALADRLTWVE